MYLEHIIITCPKYNRERTKNNIPSNLKDALSNNKIGGKLLEYLKEIGLVK